ncbi:hypothetical protein J0688_25380, partial [Vibrio parahaemolyticus]|uniref:hypothetical protein n=1 Tax=Vibrio parahaemolyticus TaxID=670 RepID=UPI001A8FB063
DSITQRASELSFEPAFSATKIVLGELGIEAAATGAALLASAADLSHYSNQEVLLIFPGFADGAALELTNAVLRDIA